MLKERIAHLKEGGAALIQNPQLLLTVLLVIVIPVAFLFSGQQFLTASSENQERLIKDKVGALQDALASLAHHQTNQEILDELFLQIMEQNPDILRIAYVVREGSDFVPKVNVLTDAASDQVEAQNFYSLAAANRDESIIFTTEHDGERRWQAYRSVDAEGGAPAAFIYTEISLAHIDTLFASRVQQAYSYLIVVIVVILFLLFRHLRIIDYGYLYKKLKETNKTRDLFTNMITHELRAPLTAMRGYASMIRENDSASSDVKGHAKTIEASTERLLDIVNDLLDVARIQSGRLTIQKEHVDLKVATEEALRALKSSADEKGLSITNEVPDDMSLNADQGRLVQILTNVVSNAIKYTEEGSISVHASREGSSTVINVKDTGIGISYKDQKKLFEPFERVDSDVAHITGTGLGMWITRELVKAMGGEIGIESIKGVGTQTVITFRD